MELAKDYTKDAASSSVNRYCIQSLFANMGFVKNRMRFSKIGACDTCNYGLPEKHIPLSAPNYSRLPENPEAFDFNAGKNCSAINMQ